jgi:hypothetical protein
MKAILRLLPIAVLMPILAAPGSARADEAAAPKRDSLAPSYTVVPVLFYSPETRWGGGAAGGVFRRLHADARPSNLLAQAQYTQNRQYQVGIHADHHGAGNRSAAWMDIGFREFPDRFFGIGGDTPDSAEEAFTARSIQAAAQWTHALREGFKAGFIGLWRTQDMVETEAGRSLAGGTVPGSGDWTVVGLGPQIAWDTRDNTYYPRSGNWAELGYAFYAPWDGPGSSFRQLRFDARHYRPLGARQVIAFQMRFEALEGEVPFALLPGLGGGNLLRGYYQGRHRDRSLAVAQAEYRFPLWRRLGGAAFAAGGTVAPDPASLPEGPLRAGGGAGLRCRLNREGVNLRVDMAFDREGRSSLYLNFLEAF